MNDAFPNESVIDTPTPTEPEKPSRQVQRESSMKLAMQTRTSLGGSDRLNHKSPLTPRHVAVSLKLMSIWHAHFILKGVGIEDTKHDNVDIKDLRKLVRLVSQFAGEKSPTKVLNELDRLYSINQDFNYQDLQKMLVNMYSNDPLSIKSEELEAEVWSEFYQPLVKSLATELGISLTVCYLLWQVFNRLADEQHHPPAMPKNDVEKILAKCARFFDREKPKYTVKEDADPMEYPELLKILWEEASNEKSPKGKDMSLEMAKELNTVFVTEELRAGTLSKRVNAFKWNKRYFSVVPFELRWWTNSKKEGTPRIFPLNEHTKLIQKDTKIEIVSGDKRIRLRGKDAKTKSITRAPPWRTDT